MAVVRVDEWQSGTYAQGRSFGAAGPAVMRRLRLEHAVDPAAAANESIVDLALADRDPDGRVRFEHDVTILQPADPSRRNGWALVDVVNRGTPTVPTYLLGDNRPLFPAPSEPPAGDGYLLEQGWALVYAGWQFDIAAGAALGLRAPILRENGRDIRGTVSYGARPSLNSPRLALAAPGHWAWPVAPGGVATLYEDDVAIPAGRWSIADNGTWALMATGFRAGCTYRCEYETVGAYCAGTGLLALRDVVPWLRGAEGIGHAMLFGVSQSGRVIRQFLSDGLNADESGEPVYEAVMPVIAGARRGQFNCRFGVPGTLPNVPSEVDEIGTWGHVLAASDARGVTPKVMALNTSSEYWRGDGARVHGDEHPAVRVHHVAGTQHPSGGVPQLFEMPILGWKGQHGFNTVDWRPILRALVRQTVDWVEGRIPPGPSVLPEGNELSDRATVLEHFRAMGKATPRVESFAIPEGAVPAVDDVGNEPGGIQLPDVAAPIGVHTGWNVRHPDTGAPLDEMFLMGSTWWFDELPSLADHLAASQLVITDLISRRLVLAGDEHLLLAAAEKRWHAARASRPR